MIKTLEIKFLRRHALRGCWVWDLMIARVSMLLKSRASPDMLPFSLCNTKRLAIAIHEQTPFFSNDTIDSVLRYFEVDRVKDLPPLLKRRILIFQHSVDIKSLTYSSGRLKK